MSEIATVTVRIAFASDPFSASPSWSDVSSDLIAINIKRGRQNQLNRFEAGTVTILLKNFDGNYWPTTAGTYSPNVKIGKRVNIRATYDSTTYDEYTGFIRKFQPGWFSEEGNLYPSMQIECADLQRKLSRAKLNSGGYSQELSGARIDNVLDDIDWNATERSIDTGKATMQATSAVGNPMDHLYNVQDSELGLFWIRGDGYAVFQERGAREVAPYDTSQATFGNGNLPIFDVDYSLDDDLLYNEICLTRVGGSEQVESDAASILAYGLQTLAKSGLLLTSDVIVAIYCLYFLGHFKQPAMYIKNFTVMPQTPGYESQLWPLVLGLDISDRITLVWDEAEIDGEYFIEGIEHSWDYREQVWRTKYQCSDATLYAPEIEAQDMQLVPTGAGALTGLTPVGGSNWDCVNEAPTPNDSDYVYNNTSVAQDTYQLANSDYLEGTINSVKIYYRLQLNTSSCTGRRIIRIGGTNYYGSTFTGPLSIETKNETLTVSPATSNPWTWSEINGMEVGVELKGYGGSNIAYCMQEYIVVNFTPTW